MVATRFIPFTVTTYPNSSFYEAKAVAGVISLAHSQHQIRGFIDVADWSPAGIEIGGAIPPIMFMTTADTIIGQDVINEANLKEVAIWQTSVSQLAGFPGLSGSVLQLGWRVPLNPRVFKGRVLPLPPLRPGKLRMPGGAGAPNDPDPPEVKE
jgi:hypothetical protein